MSFLPLPQKFDENEWFVLISAMVCLLIVFTLRKKFSVVITLAIWLFNVNLVKTADFTLGVKPFNFYDFMDVPDFEFVYDISHLTLYPSIAYIFLYLYEKKNIHGIQTIFYVLICALAATGYEWLATQFKVLRYIDEKWSLWHSFPVYVAIFLLNIFLLYFLKRFTVKDVKGVN
jgi:hypothetical protein